MASWVGRGFAVLALLAALSAQAAGEVLIQSPAILNPGAPITESVLRECSVETMVAQQVLRAMGRKNRGISVIRNPQEAAGHEKVLKLTILAVHGVGGGGFSGAKSITVRADLVQNAEIIGSSVFTRRGSSSMLPGTCALLERIAFNIGSRINRWLPAALAGEASPLSGIGVLVPAFLDPAAAVPDYVKLSCSLEDLVGNQVFQTVGRKFPGTKTLPSSELATSGNVLKMTILGVETEKVTAYFPIQRIKLRVDLLQNGKAIGTNIFERSGQSGVMEKAGACATLEQVGVAIGKEVALWLPTVVVASAPNAADDDPGEASEDKPRAKQSAPPTPQYGPRLEDLPLPSGK